MTQRTLILFFLFLIIQPFLSAQTIELKNKIYNDKIKTPTLHLKGLQLSQPIVDLNSAGRLVFSFDDLYEDQVDYFYSIIHCTADWERTNLEPIEYIEGYDEGEIYDFFYSGATREPYTHYRLVLPNDEISWKISGNYVLVVYYYENNVKVPIITRRFMVVESEVSISASFRFPIETEYIRTHHEMAVNVNTNQMRLRSPEQQLRLYVYQNGRYDALIGDQRYDRYLGSQYAFDRFGKYVFPAGKEFRHLNNRYINSPAGDIMSLERDEEGYYAVRYPEASRLHDSYLTYYDINGQFIIQNKEEPLRQRQIVDYSTAQIGDSTVLTESTSTQSYIQDSLCLRCEYVKVLFSLKVRDKLKEDVYLFGGLTGWELDPTYKMEYDVYRKMYFKELLLKQGYYDYVYALRSKDGSIDTHTLEGDWHETENDYLILVYDRHTFNRYDRLIGARMVNSSQ